MFGDRDAMNSRNALYVYKESSGRQLPSPSLCSPRAFRTLVGRASGQGSKLQGSERRQGGAGVQAV